jgi:hypothetical protein
VKNFRTILGGTALVFAGLAAGIYLQHRWPLGRVGASFQAGPAMASRSLADLAALPSARRLVLVVAGQSNAANYGETRRTAGYRVFAFDRGEVYTAVDPLPGGDGDGGSIWTRLGARLAMTDDYDAVIIAVVAQSSTQLKDWTPGGSCHQRLVETLQQLAAAKLPPDYFLWQQGESEAGSPAAAGPAYLRELRQLHETCRQIFPGIVFVAAHATYGASPAVNEQIRLAQTAAAELPGALPGPDLDALGEAFRRDGVHFNDGGLSAAADLWFAALKSSLARRNLGFTTR